MHPHKKKKKFKVSHFAFDDVCTWNEKTTTMLKAFHYGGLPQQDIQKHSSSIGTCTSCSYQIGGVIPFAMRPT